MWLKVQKVLRFIPGINIITFISWIVCGFKKKLGVNYFVKNIIIMFALVAIVIMIGRGIAVFTSNEIFSKIVLIASFIIYTYIASFIAVNEQITIANGEYK